jgi:hypothetical protein
MLQLRLEQLADERDRGLSVTAELPHATQATDHLFDTAQRSPRTVRTNQPHQWRGMRHGESWVAGRATDRRSLMVIRPMTINSTPPASAAVKGS